MTSLVRAENVSKHYGGPVTTRFSLFGAGSHVLRAVDGVDLTIGEHETVGLVGESGSGKSTLARLIVRLEEPTSGRIWFRDQDLGEASPEDLRKLRSHFQIVFQNPFWSLNPRKTIGDIIRQPLVTHGYEASNTQRVGELLEQVGMAPSIANKYPHQLSGGQRQRVAIARAIALNPELVILDEVTSAVDVSVQAQIVKLLADLQKERKMAYLFVSHDLSLVRLISRRIAVMYLGKIVEEAPSDELFANPLHPYTQMLISSIPLPDIEKPWRTDLPRGEPPDPAQIPAGCRFHPRCSYAMPVCRGREPPLVEVRPNHKVACYVYPEVLAAAQ